MMFRILMLLFTAGLCSSQVFQNSRNILKTYGGGNLISWEPRTMISSQDFPCLEEGFYPHPKNCSRFYRCVDFTNEKAIFSRYLFECPQGEVFAHTIETCVPGVCPEPVGSSTDQEGEDGSQSAAQVTGTVTAGTDSVPPEETDPGTGSVIDVEPSESSGTDAAEESEPVETAPEEASGLPPVVSPIPVSPADVPQDVGECLEGDYVQHKQYCNLFHLCNDENNLFSCYEGTAFSNEHQMCRLSQYEEKYCEGKEIFVPTAESFRNAFQWEEVGVMPYLNNPVNNANPFIFTNLRRTAGPEDSFGFDHQKTKSDSNIKLKSKEDDKKPKRRFDFKSMVNTLGSISSLFQNKKKSSDDKELKRKSLESNKEDIFMDASSFSDMNDYDVVAIPYYSLNSDPYSDLTEKSVSSMSDLYSMYPGIGVVDMSQSYPANPLFQGQELNQKSGNKFATTIPFSSLASAGTTNPYLTLSSLLRSQNRGNIQSQFLNQGAGIGVISPYRFSSMSPSTFSPSLSSPYISQLSSFPSFGYSPYMPASASYWPYGASSMPQLSMVASPYGYFMTPNYGGMSSLRYPSVGSGFPSASVNPYSVLKIDEKQLGELLKASLLSTDTEISMPSNRLLSEKSATSFPFSSQQQYPAFEARTDEGETYQVVPLTDDDVVSLAQHGLLDRVTAVNEPVTYEDVKNLKEGEILLASFPKK